MRSSLILNINHKENQKIITNLWQKVKISDTELVQLQVDSGRRAKDAIPQNLQKDIKGPGLGTALTGAFGHTDNETKKYQTGGAVNVAGASSSPSVSLPGEFTVPGSGDGDQYPIDLPTGSFVLNRTATRTLEGRQGLQSGGATSMVSTLLEPGERVFMPGQWDSNIATLNSMVPRFGPSRLQTGGMVKQVVADEQALVQAGIAAAVPAAAPVAAAAPIAADALAGAATPNIPKSTLNHMRNREADDAEFARLFGGGGAPKKSTIIDQTAYDRPFSQMKLGPKGPGAALPKSTLNHMKNREEDDKEFARLFGTGSATPAPTVQPTTANPPVANPPRSRSLVLLNQLKNNSQPKPNNQPKSNSQLDAKTQNLTLSILVPRLQAVLWVHLLWVTLWVVFLVACLVVCSVVGSNSNSKQPRPVTFSSWKVLTK